MLFPKGNSSHHLKRIGEFLQSVVKETVKGFSNASQADIRNPLRYAALHRITALFVFSEFDTFLMNYSTKWWCSQDNNRIRTNPIIFVSVIRQEWYGICQLCWPESRARSHGRSTWIQKCPYTDQKWSYWADNLLLLKCCIRSAGESCLRII